MNLAAMVHEQLLKTEQVKNLYKGDCKGCGECYQKFVETNNELLDMMEEHNGRN